MPFAYDLTKPGRPRVQIDDPNTLAVLFEQGKIGFLPDQTVPMEESGNIVDVPANEIAERLRIGSRFATDAAIDEAERQHYHYEPTEIAKAGAEGALAGATLGIAPMVAREVAPEYADAAAKRAEGSPGVSLAGEILPAAAAAIASGGTSLAARGVQAATALPGAALGAGRAVGRRAATALGPEVAASRLGRAGVGAVEGFVESVPFSVGQELTQAAHQDREVSAQRMAAGVGLGALLGLGVGGAVGSLGRGGSKAIKLRGKGGKSKGPYRDPAEEAIATISEDAPGLTAGLREWAADRRDKSLVKALGLRGIGELKKLGRNLPGIEKRVRHMAEVVSDYEMPDGRKLIGWIDDPGDFAAKLRQAHDDVAAQLDAAKAAVSGEAADATEAWARVRAAVRDGIKSDAPDTVRAAEDALRQFQAVKEAVDAGDSLTLGRLEALRRDVRRQIQPDNKLGISPLPPANKFYTERAERALDDFIKERSDELILKAGAPGYREAKSQYAGIRTALDIAENGEVRDWGNRWASPTDYLLGAVGGIAGGPMTGLAMAAIHNQIRTRGQSVATRAFDAMARGNSRTAGAVSRYIKRHEGADKLIPAKLPKSQKRSVGVAVPASIEVFGSDKKTRRKNYHKAVEDITRLSSNPAEAVEVLGNSLSEVAKADSVTAAATSATAMNALAFLHSKLPPGTIDLSGLTPHLNKFTPSDEELAEFARYYVATVNPDSVLEDLDRGWVSHEAIEALQSAWPHIYNDMRAEAFRALTDTRKELPRKARINLDILLDLGGAGDWTLEASFIQRQQQMFEQQRAETEAAAQGMSQSAPDVGGAYATPTQGASQNLSGGL